jgi:hypothetical protein
MLTNYFSAHQQGCNSYIDVCDFASHNESDILEKRANVVPKNASKGKKKKALQYFGTT